MNAKRKTIQKMEIEKFFYNNKNHPTAYDVYNYIKKKIPTISFATIYNNLNSMLEEGKLIEIIDGDKKRFDPDTSPHDHFICIKCGKVYDIEKIIKRGISYKNFKVISHTTYIKGVCEKCLKSDKEGGRNGK
jgi:Fur family peroxide stress response transcriptional regulator